MKWVWLTLVMIGICPALTDAVPLGSAQYGEVPARQYSERQDQCHLMYYNFCSGWVWNWMGYCYGWFGDAVQIAYGTCFDLADCPANCRHLDDVWFACKAFDYWGVLDIEIYCADQNGCPIGGPLAGIYDYSPPYMSHWQHFAFGGLPVCQCDEAGTGKFIVMVTDHTSGYYIDTCSDLNHRNMGAGCEEEWRCAGHSYVYRNVVSYCDVYGAPGPLWVAGADHGCTNYPSIPPGCHDYLWDTGYFTEWLIDCYISCLGPTATEKGSWSEVKRLYR
jgi:hypothetical protein